MQDRTQQSAKGGEPRFDIDVKRCVCGGKLKIIAAIGESAVIERILTHLGLAAQPPLRAPALRVVLLQAA